MQRKPHIQPYFSVFRKHSINFVQVRCALLSSFFNVNLKFDVNIKLENFSILTYQKTRTNGTRIRAQTLYIKHTELTLAAAAAASAASACFLFSSSSWSNSFILSSSTFGQKSPSKYGSSAAELSLSSTACLSMSCNGYMTYMTLHFIYDNLYFLKNDNLHFLQTPIYFEVAVLQSL